jgi:hypothetical protein
MDDADSTIYFFVAEEGTMSSFQGIRVERHGLFGSLYAGSHY